MKRIVLLFIPALICGAVFTGCSNNEVPKEEKNTGELYVMGTRSETITTYSSFDELDLLFTGNDIKMFNVASNDTLYGEIIFNNLNVEDLSRSIGNYSTIYFFIGETLVFYPPIKIYSPISSMSSNDLQMNIGDGKIYLWEFYQTWDWMTDAAERESKLKAQEENSMMRKKQLEVFFKYLSDAGKIEYAESPEFPPVIDEPMPPAVVDTTGITVLPPETGDPTPPESVKDESDILHGKWQLISISPLNAEGMDLMLVDFSPQNIIYEFKTNNVLTVSGEINNGYGGLEKGKHFYEVTLTKFISDPLGLPAPHLVRINTIPYSFSFGYMSDRPGMVLVCRDECGYAFHFVKK